MAHRCKEKILCSVRLFQLHVFLLQGPLTSFAVGNVTNGAHRQDAFVRRERAETDFNGEFQAVFALAEQLQSSSHRAGSWLSGIIRTVADMRAPKTFG